MSPISSTGYTKSLSLEVSLSLDPKSFMTQAVRRHASRNRTTYRDHRLRLHRLFTNITQATQQILRNTVPIYSVNKVIRRKLPQKRTMVDLISKWLTLKGDNASLSASVTTRQTRASVEIPCRSSSEPTRLPKRSE